MSPKFLKFWISTTSILRDELLGVLIPSIIHGDGASLIACIPPGPDASTLPDTAPHIRAPATMALCGGRRRRQRRTGGGVSWKRGEGWGSEGGRQGFRQQSMLKLPIDCHPRADESDQVVGA